MSMDINVFRYGTQSATSRRGPHTGPGYHSVVWNGRDHPGNTLPSGMYLYHFSASSPEAWDLFRRSGKLLLAK